MPRVFLALLLIPIAGAPAEAAQPEACGACEPQKDIVVIAERLRASITGPVEAEVSLGSDAVMALGASNLADILNQMAALTGGAQARAGSGPVLLVNGRRIGSFEEVRNLPPEAIERIDILPEEAALRMGYPARSKPVNVVLKPRYAAGTGELEDRVATHGLRNDLNTELNFVDIAGDNRMTANLQYQIGDAITEDRRQIQRPLDTRAASEAGIVSSSLGGALRPLGAAFAGVPATSGRRLADFAAVLPADDTGRFRTLVPSTSQFTADGTFARALPGASAISATARYDRFVADELLGPAIAAITVPAGGASPFALPVLLRRSLPASPVQSRRTVTDSYHLGGQLAGYGRWQWSAAVNLDRVDLRRRRTGGIDSSALQAAIDRSDLADPFASSPTALIAPGPASKSASHDQLATAEFFVSGPLAKLPAGDVNLSLRATLGRETIGAVQDSGSTRLARDHVGGQASLDIPLLHHGRLGALDAGLNASVDRYSDAGTITGYGATLAWKPAKPVSLLLGVSRDQLVPTLVQRGAVVESTPEAAFFDFATANSFVAARIDGGNPALRADRRSLAKIELGLKPLAGLGLTATFTDIRDRGALFAFPGVTAASEAALPDRIVRDASGAISSVDFRAFNALREDWQELRLALAFGKTFGKGDGPRVPGGGGFGGGHSFGAAGSMIQLSLSDTIRLRDAVTLAPGLPAIDLIGDNSLGDGLRVPRHRLEGQLSATHHGFGLRTTASWTSGGDAGAASPGALQFADRFQLGVRLFYYPARDPALLRAIPWVQGVRLMFVIDNPFDGYQRVRDRTGRTPLAYQRGLLDPIGRTLRLSLRKTFD